MQYILTQACGSNYQEHAKVLITLAFVTKTHAGVIIHMQRVIMPACELNHPAHSRAWDIWTDRDVSSLEILVQSFRNYPHLLNFLVSQHFLDLSGFPQVFCIPRISLNYNEKFVVRDFDAHKRTRH